MGVQPPEQVEAVFRNRSVAVVGVAVGFTPAFPTSRASSPRPRHPHRLIGTVPLVDGAARRLDSLAALLHIDSLQRAIHDRAVRPFLSGPVLVCAGLVGGSTLDALIEAKRS